MKRAAFNSILLTLWIYLSLAFSCSACGDTTRSTEPSASKEQRMETHTIVFGGDFILGRKFNKVAAKKRRLKNAFHDALPLLQNADLTVVNAEGVIAQSGRQIDKMMKDPVYYRIHPNVLDIFSITGIDAVAIGNNHAGDYGAAAFTEMLHHLQSVNVGYFGGGINRKDAMTPSYHKMGSIVVALVGGEFSGSQPFGVQKNAPGILVHSTLSRGKNIDEMVSQYSKILSDARRYAHVVLFSPHWGYNYAPRPTRHMTALAHRLIDAGYDGIFGHSAHQAHGIEMYKGKPIVYDMGNLLIDWSDQPADAHSFLCEVSISKAGVESLRAFPLQLKENATFLSKDQPLQTAIRDIAAYSQKFDTTLTTHPDSVSLTLQPGAVFTPERSSLPSRAAVSMTGISKGWVLDSLPDSAVPLNVAYQNGVVLVGYRVVSRKISPGDKFVIDLFFKAAHPIEKGVNIHLEAHGKLPDTRQPGIVYGGHMPGDWTFPMEEWPVGKIIQDRTVMRMKLHPEGEVKLFAGLWNGKVIVEEKLIPVGQTVFDRTAPLCGEQLAAMP